MEIKRTRYVVMRNNRTEIMCGSARNAGFRDINDIKNVSIKTYCTAIRAVDAYYRNFFIKDSNKDDVEAVEIVETLKSV